MKKSILMTIILVMIISMASVVNAANETKVNMSIGGITQAEKGNEVTITVSSPDKAICGGNFTVSYNGDILKFVEVKGIPDTGVIDSDTKGKIDFNFASVKGIKSFSITFTAIKAGEATVNVVPNELFDAEENPLALSSNLSHKVTVTEPTSVPNPEQKPEQEQAPAPSTDNTQAKGKMPQTGIVTSYYVIAAIGLVVMVIGIAVATKKMRK